MGMGSEGLPPAPPDPPPTQPSDDGTLANVAPAEAKEKAVSPRQQESEKLGSPGAPQPTPRGSGSQAAASPTDGIWATFAQLQLKQDVPGLAASLQLVEEALTRETVRLEEALVTHARDTDRSLSLSCVSAAGESIMEKIEEEDDGPALGASGSSPLAVLEGEEEGEVLHFRDTGSFSVADTINDDTGSLLDPALGVRALARFLEISCTSWYLEGGGAEVLEAERLALWDHYSHEWLRQAPSARLRSPNLNAAMTMALTSALPSSEGGGGGCQPERESSFPLLAAVILGSPEEAIHMYSGKKAKNLHSMSRKLFAGDGQAMMHSENVRILRAVRRVDLCQKLALEELKGDLPVILGKAACLINPMDVDALVTLIDTAFLAALRKDVCAALLTVCHTDAAATGGGEENPCGLKVYFYDQEASVVDAPYLNEEILIMRWDDEELRSGRTRWWTASVVDSPLFGSSLTRRRASMIMSHEGPLVQVRDSMERCHLRGSFYVRPNMVDTLALMDALKVGDRVLMKDDREASVYFEGTIFKIQGGNRAFGVKMDGLEAARFVSRDMLLPGPTRITPWAILSGMVRMVHDLPMKVHELLMNHANAALPLPTDAPFQASRKSGPSPLSSPVSGAGSSQRPSASAASTTTRSSANATSLRGSTLSHSHGGGGQRSDASSYSLCTLLLDQSLGTALAAAWVLPMADRLLEVQRYLLVNVSRVFKGRVLGLERAMDEEIAADRAIATLRPVMSDLGHYLSLCIVGCHAMLDEHFIFNDDFDPSWTTTTEHLASGSAVTPPGLHLHHSGSGSGSWRDLGGFTTPRGTNTMRNMEMRSHLVDQLAKLRQTQTERRKSSNVRNSSTSTSTPPPVLNPGSRHSSNASSNMDGSRGSLEQSGLGPDALDARLGEAGKAFAAGFSAVLGAVNLEMRRVLEILRTAMLRLRYPCEMKRAAAIMTLAAFLRNTWDHLVHRLDFSMRRFALGDDLATAFSALIWRVNEAVDSLLVDLHDHLLTISVHWCRNYFYCDVGVNDWQSNKTYMQDRRCTYGVLAWSLFVRGLVFDFKTALYNPFSSSEAREVLSAVLARTMPPLVCQYLQIDPSRTRLTQYVSDLGCILVTTLTLFEMLKSDSFTAMLAHDSQSVSGGSGSGGLASVKAYREIMPASNRPLEGGLKPHDGAHQTTLANLRIVEHYCGLLLGMIAFLQAPAGVVAWYICLLSNCTNAEGQAAYDAAKAQVLSSIEAEEGVEVEPPLLGRRRSAEPFNPGQRVQQGKERPMKDLLTNIDIQAFSEAFQASLELGDVFNVLAESQKLGADRDDLGEEESAAAGLTPRRSTSSAALMFSEYYISRATLTDLKMRWKEVLLTRQVMTKDQVVLFVRKRYELCDCSYPPLNPAEQARQAVLMEALGVYDLLTDLKEDANSAECLQS